MGTWCSRGACLIQRNVTVEASTGAWTQCVPAWLFGLIVFLTNWSDLGPKGYISIKTQEQWIENAQGVTSLIQIAGL